MANDSFERAWVRALVQALLDHTAEATSADIRMALGYIARSPFATHDVGVPKELRGRVYRGYRFGRRAPSDLVHLAKRIVIERQWSEGTTFEEFVADVQSAVSHPDAGLVVYHAYGVSFVGILSPNTVPVSRRGEKTEAYLFVLYDCDHGRITTAYQVSGVATISLPGEARWLM